MASPLFIAIGVSKAAGMPPLDGVLKGVSDLSGWATGHGYDVISVNDGQAPVDIDLIRNQLTPKDANGIASPALLLDRPRIVVYFCGHAFASWPDQYWVLSAGPDYTRQRISANAFRDTLATYAPKQIAIISDACRTPHSAIGTGDPVVDPYSAMGSFPQKDMFYSSRLGEASFAVPAKNGNPAYCVFSDVLIRALSAPDGVNLDQLYADSGKQVVTSQSLADYLEKHVPAAALSVDRTQEPQCDPGFRPRLNGYVEFATPVLEGPSALGGSPPAVIDARRFEVYATQRAKLRQADRLERSRSEWRVPLVQAIQKQARRLGPFRQHREELVFLSGRRPRDIVGAVRPHPDRPQAPSRSADYGVPGPGAWHSVRYARASSLSQPVVVISADRYSVLPLFRDLWCAAIFDGPNQSLEGGGGVDLVTWGNYLESSPSSEKGSLHSSEALKGLTNGALSSSDVGLVASRIRHRKHADPLLGIVAAYLYSNVGDTENIRRMCFYYKAHQQDVPFDIAMLAGVPLRLTKDGGFSIRVPEVEALPIERRSPKLPNYTWEATPAVTVGVAGLTPVLRAGWPYLRNSEHRVHRECWELVDHLTPAPISTFAGHDVGDRLTQILGLR